MFFNTINLRFLTFAKNYFYIVRKFVKTVPEYLTHYNYTKNLYFFINNFYKSINKKFKNSFGYPLLKKKKNGKKKSNEYLVT